MTLSKCLKTGFLYCVAHILCFKFDVYIFYWNLGIWFEKNSKIFPFILIHPIIALNYNKAYFLTKTVDAIPYHHKKWFT